MKNTLGETLKKSNYTDEEIQLIQNQPRKLTLLTYLLATFFHDHEEIAAFSAAEENDSTTKATVWQADFV